MLDWFEEQTSLWVLIVTGTGRAFCAGQVRFISLQSGRTPLTRESRPQDLKNWQKTAGTNDAPDGNIRKNPHGFGSLARRRTKKTFICALNGFAFGGGAEIVVNAGSSRSFRGSRSDIGS